VANRLRFAAITRHRKHVNTAGVCFANLVKHGKRFIAAAIVDEYKIDGVRL
jgi:hypothetical protein